MVGSRAATALAGIAASLLISAAAWYYYETLLLFLFVPFVPFLLGGRGGGDRSDATVSECPACGFRTDDPGFDYCPRDGTRLD